MATETQISILKTYAPRVREALRAHPDHTEPGLAPEFVRSLEALLGTMPMAPRLNLIPEFRNSGVGRPDIALVRQGELARAFVELKSIDKTTDGSLLSAHGTPGAPTIRQAASGMI